LLPPFEKDRALLAAFRVGRADVLARTYHALVDDVFRVVALGFVTRNGSIRPERDPDEQRAVVQEVFVRAFAERARLAYDGLRPYRPYLLTIAKNVMIDRARSRSSELARTSELDVDAIIDSDAAIPGEVEETAEQQQQRAAAATYVAGLDEELRAFVQLRFDRELSQIDVAEQLGVTRRRVRTLERRVLTGLRKFLKKYRPGSVSPQ
jgi:RNA polymerase sigma-70 factor (ECF subfamily)